MKKIGIRKSFGSGIVQIWGLVTHWNDGVVVSDLLEGEQASGERVGVLGLLQHCLASILIIIFGLEENCIVI